MKLHRLFILLSLFSCTSETNSTSQSENWRPETPKSPDAVVVAPKLKPILVRDYQTFTITPADIKKPKDPLLTFPLCTAAKKQGSCLEAQFTDSLDHQFLVVKYPKEKYSRLLTPSPSSLYDRKSKKTKLPGIPLVSNKSPLEVKDMGMLVKGKDRKLLILGVVSLKKKGRKPSSAKALVLQVHDIGSKKKTDIDLLSTTTDKFSFKTIQSLGVNNFGNHQWMVIYQTGDSEGKLLCRDFTCAGEYLPKDLRFAAARQVESTYQALRNPTMVWLKKEGSESIQGFALKNEENNDVKIENYPMEKLDKNPRISIPIIPLPNHGQIFDAITVQERVVYVWQDDNIANVHVGCIEIKDGQSCFDTKLAHKDFALTSPLKISAAKLQLQQDGMISLTLQALQPSQTLRYIVTLPATHRQLRLLQYPEELAISWRNMFGFISRPQPNEFSMFVEPVNTTYLPAKLGVNTNSIRPNEWKNTVEAKYLKVWPQYMLAHHCFDRPNITDIERDSGKKLFELTICHSTDCWTTVPASTKEFSALVDSVAVELRASYPSLSSLILGMK